MFNWARQSIRQSRFEELALPYLDALHYAALRLTKDESLAEDLVQETFLRAYRAFHQLAKDESCRAWLSKIMTNIWINQFQKQVHARALLDIYELDPSHEEASVWGHRNTPAGPETAVIQKLFREDVEQALQKLPHSFRIVVILADIEGFSYKEVAALLKCPIGTVMSRLHRGRKLLQKSLWVYARGNQGCTSPGP